MKCLPNTLRAHAGRTVTSAAAVAAIAAALPCIAMGPADGQTASPSAPLEKQTVTHAATHSASTTKSTVMSKATNGSHADRVEARIKDLHVKLKISPAQEDQWNAVTQVMRDNARTLDSLTQARIDNANSMNAVDDVRSYSQIAEAHAEGLKRFVPAFQALYDAMTDSQRKDADQIFRGHIRMAGRAAAKHT